MRGKDLGRIVSRGDSGQVRERKDLSRIHFGEHGDTIARVYHPPGWDSGARKG